MHPLYQHISQLKKQLEGTVTPHGLRVGGYPRDPQKIVHINRQLIESISVYGNDRMYWLADGYFEELEQEPELRAFIRARLPKPELYSAVIAELQQWGYLKAQGLTPKLTQQEGVPDLEFGHNEDGGPFFFDVKTASDTSSPRSIRGHIKKANKQIKRVGNAAPGGCYIWFLPILIGGYAPSSIPNELMPYAVEIDRVMKSNSCRSVSRVVLTWQEVCCKGNIPGWQTWVVVRRSHVWMHTTPKCDFVINNDYSSKSTCAVNIRLGSDQDKPVWDIDTTLGQFFIQKRIIN